MIDKQAILQGHASEGSVAGGDDALRLRALHGVKWAAAANWSAQAMGFVTMVVLARLIAPDEFGVYSIASALIMVVAGLSQVGLPLALVQRQELQEDHLHSAFWCVTGLALVLAGGGFLGRSAIATLIGIPALATFVPALALALPIQAMAGVFNAPLMRKLDFRRAALATSSGALAGAIAAIALALAGFGIWSLVAQVLIAAVVTLGHLVAYSTYRPAWRFSPRRLRELWGFGALSMTTDFVALFDVRLGPILLGGLLGPAAAGLYAMSRRVLDMGQQVFVASIGQVAIPAFSRLTDNPVRMRTAYLNAVQSVAALTVPMFGLVAVMSREVVSIFLGPAWLEGAEVLQLLALAAVAQPFGWITVSALAADGRAGSRLGLQLLSLLLSVIVLLVAWRAGLVAVAWGFVIKSALMHVALARAGSRSLGVSWRDHFGAIGPIAAAACLGLGSAYLAREGLVGRMSSMPLLASCLAPTALVYLLALRLAAPATCSRLLGYAADLLAPLRSART